MDKKILSNIALFLTALIWGLSFVAQKAGMDFVGPFTFNTARSILGGFSLLPVIALLKLTQEDKRTPVQKDVQHIRLAQGGIACGVALWIAMTIQQYCMLHATAGKAGFITALYIIYVPIIAMFFGKKVAKNVWISVGLAVIGLYLLCFKDTFGGFSIYDLWLLIAAFFYGLHIIVVNHFSRKANATKMSCVQFFIVGLLSMPFMFIFEHPHWAQIIACKIPILYAGILTCGVAYTLQIFGQKFTPSPTVASLILSLESVFAVVGGSLILHEIMSIKEVFGCIFMITAVILSQLNAKPKKVEPTSEDEDPIVVSK